MALAIHIFLIGTQKHKTMRYYILLLLLGITSYSLQAQQKKQKTITYIGQVFELQGDRGEGVMAAVVELFVPGDTLRSITDDNGTFYIKKVPLGKARIRLSHLSYETLEKEIEVKAVQGWGMFEMKTKSVDMDDVVVKGKVPSFTMKGDTIVFHAAAFKTLMGDETMKIVEQLPGVEIDEKGGVKVFGKDLTKTYVDGKLIFGDNALDALNNLAADDVISIKSYDQLSAKDKLAGKLSAEKERVFNIETKSKLLSATVGHVLASYGSNLGEPKQRYAAGATGNFFSEKLLLKANAFVNNVDRRSNRIDDMLEIRNASSPYSKNAYAGIGMTRQFGDVEVGPSLSVDYSFDDQRNKSESYSIRRYIPTADYTQRIYNDSAFNSSHSSAHVLSTSYRDFEHHFLNAGMRLSYNDNKDFSASRTLTLLNDRKDYTAQDQRNKKESYDWSASFGMEVVEKGAFHLMTDANAQIGNNSGNGLRLDTLSSTATNRVYHTDIDGYRRNYEAGLSASFNSIKNRIREDMKPEELEELMTKPNYSFNLSLRYRRTAEKNKEIRVEADGMMMEIDSLMSRDYTRDYHTLITGVDYMFAKGERHFNIGVDMEYSKRGEDRILYPENTMRQHFLTWSPHVMWNLGSFTSGLFFSYSGRSQLPSFEQLSQQIDDRTPLFLSSGNPNLKPSYTHSLSVHGNYVCSNTSVLSGGANLSITQDQVISRSRYYADGTTLEDWGGYQVSPGATFTTYENLNGTLNISGNVGYSCSVPFIKSNLNTRLMYNFGRNASYVEDALNHNYNQSATVSFNLRTNFSRSYKVELLSYSVLSYAKSTMGNSNNYYNQRVELQSKNNFTEKWFLNAMYSYNMVHPLTEGSSGNREMNLNAVVGYRFLKNRASFSLSAFDLLNQSTSFNTTTQVDYELETWRPTFGRFWTVNFSYKFNSTGVASSGKRRYDLNEGEKENNMYFPMGVGGREIIVN